ncbi:FAD-dependent oxidoreductase [Kutzneria kofuensis]|uniref:Glycine/D-amino acid oxidase-like deaminating enzyme n=1 Tax=Kutzneria kofuensis TaxID=103725 RepID=A0A7W9KSC5_9PSEU|nr:FAD-dependent oxidoreductase [Kutzneria kofuensis]MBB5897840.1 glycine/D-amino acid oxidase-like deaminating enzyme [Kutzneria kofuensis]
MLDAEFFDLTVVGGGPVGLAAAGAAAARGLSVLVVERFDFHGGHGSSGGAERQWRLQYAETDLSALTLHARTAWRDLAARTRRRVVHETGSLWFGDTTQSSSEGQIEAAVAVLDELEIAYQRVDNDELRTRYGFHDLPADYHGIHQPQGGVLDVAAARWALLDSAAGLGCALHSGETVLDIAPDGNGVTVHTDRGRYRCGHVVVTAGAWTPAVLDRIGVSVDLTLYELTQAHFRLRTDRDYPTWFAFQNATDTDSNLFYGFGRTPWADDDLVQVSPLFEADPIADPAAARRAPREHDLRRVTEWVRDHMPDLEPQPLHAGTCVAALPTDHGRQFYLGSAAGLVPDGERVVVCAGGWGFKFVPVFGEACVQLALDGRTRYGLERSGLTATSVTGATA